MHHTTVPFRINKSNYGGKKEEAHHDTFFLTVFPAPAITKTVFLREGRAETMEDNKRARIEEAEDVDEAQSVELLPEIWLMVFAHIKLGRKLWRLRRVCHVWKDLAERAATTQALKFIRRGTKSISDQWGDKKDMGDNSIYCQVLDRSNDKLEFLAHTSSIPVAEALRQFRPYNQYRYSGYMAERDKWSPYYDKNRKAVALIHTIPFIASEAYWKTMSHENHFEEFSLYQTNHIMVFVIPELEASGKVLYCSYEYFYKEE
jgi:hypothetical protein